MAAGDADPARVPCAGVGVGSVVSAGYVVSVPERLVPDSARVPDSTSGISSLVQTLIVFYALSFASVNFITDLVYRKLDPRVQF